MSVEAITWALKRQIKPSSTKFVLVVLANCADTDTAEAYPSVKYLESATSQDRKTVMENLKRLTARGYIVDTGARKGKTHQVPVYRLIMNGNYTEIGTVTENSTENGTVPFFPSNSTEIPAKQYRNSHETVPKTGHGNIINTTNETSGKPNKRAKAALVELPAWLPAEAWENWIAYRKSIKAPLNEHAAKLCIAKLATLRDQGNDPVAVIDQSIMSGKWTGLFEIKNKQPTRAAPAGPQHLGRAGQITAMNAQKWLEEQDAIN